MATIGTAVTLMDIQRRLDPDGKIAKLISMLAQTNRVNDDAMWMPCNDGTSHLTTILTGLPEVTWRKLNYGTQPSKATSKQVTDTTGMMTAMSQVDEKLVKINNNDPDWRLSEEQQFIEAMNQEMATTIFYGDTDANPERFMGLAPRFSSLSAENGGQIIDAGGTDLAGSTSIWGVVWGQLTCHMIYPNGSQAGLSMDDLGVETVPDSQTPTGYYRAYRSMFEWDAGMSVRNWQYISRIANIDVSALSSFGSLADTSANLIRYLTQMYHLVKDWNMGRGAIYCNSTILTWLDIMVNEKITAALSSTIIDSKPVLMFRGIPIRKCDAILNTEARVS